jgi:Domain of unknown function (DUF4149)
VLPLGFIQLIEGVAMWSHLLIASNLGVMFFFSVAVAPAIFKVLPAEWAGVYVRQFFPKYYLYLGAVGAVAACLSEDFDFLLISLGCSVMFFFLAFYLTPKINQAKDQGLTRSFQVMHLLSVGINVLQMGLFAYLLTRAVG